MSIVEQKHREKMLITKGIKEKRNETNVVIMCKRYKT